MRLNADPAHKETIDRVFGFFADRCPVYRTLKPAIDFRIELDIETPAP